jgi:hypothetical protein
MARAMAADFFVAGVRPQADRARWRHRSQMARIDKRGVALCDWRFRGHKVADRVSVAGELVVFL